MNMSGIRNEKGAEVIEAAAQVDEVTVMEDRARVVRRGKAALPPGRSIIRIPGVSPLASDRSLSGKAVSGPKDARIANARIKRSLRAMIESRPEEAAAAWRELQAASAEAENLEASREAIGDEVKSLGRALAATVREINSDAAFGTADAAEWGRVADLFSNRESAARKERVALEAELRRARERVRDLQARVDSLSNPGTYMGADVEAEILSGGQGIVEFEIAYVVPCACWRPAHTISLAGDSGKCMASVETDAFVWQKTGEDWANARLSFSTQRPSLGTKPPPLSEDVVVAKDKSDKVEVEARDSEIRTAGLGGAATAKSDDLPGIDDSGEVCTMHAAHRTTVPTDGRPHRIPIGRFEAEADVQMVCMPEISGAAVRRARLKNASKTPLLAGPVDLVGASGYVGRASVLYIAPGETFETGFGPDPEIRIRRSVDRVEKEKGTLSKWFRTSVAVMLNISNIGRERKSFRLIERIPISEVEQVRIEFQTQECKPKAVPDGNGFLEWVVDLPPAGRTSISFSYMIEKTKEVAGSMLI